MKLLKIFEENKTKTKNKHDLEVKT